MAQVKAETVNRMVAIVNDEVITDADVRSHANALLEEQSTAMPSDPQAVELHAIVLRRLIEQRLMLQEARREGIVVGADEIIERFDAMRERFDADEAFEQSLLESRLTKEQLKERIREQLLVQRLIDVKVRSTIAVSPQEVSREVVAHPELAKGGDRVRAFHILVRVTDDQPEGSARARIEEIARQLRSGAPFTALAKRYSEDSYAEDGGLMDWVAQGELMPELDAALFSLKPGEVSAPIQTRLGFHLLKVEDRRSAGSLSVTEAHHSVYQQLYQQKFQQAFTRWLTQLKQRAYIQILEP